MEENNSQSPMLEAIMKMETRLTASITTARDKDISELETRLNENIKSTIDNSIKEALKVNFRLNRKVQQLSAKQHRMKNQLTKIESK